MKWVVAVMLSVSLTPLALYAEDFDDVQDDVVEDVVEDNAAEELRDLIGAMKSDRHINRDRVKRVKDLIREKKGKKSKKDEPEEEELT